MKPIAFLVFWSQLFLITACQRATPISPGPDAEETQFNRLTDTEKAAGWLLLFDGNTLSGWKRYGADSIGPMWMVQDGLLVCNAVAVKDNSTGAKGSLMTVRQFNNFDLLVEWRIDALANSGIIYHVTEKPEFKEPYDTGPEYQLIDELGWKDPLRDVQRTGSYYDMYAAPATKKLNPVGQWNASRIVYDNGRVEHYLNGEKIVEFDEGSDDFQARYKRSKWVEYPAWNSFKTGSIALQDHGTSNMYFRNIKIRPL